MSNVTICIFVLVGGADCCDMFQAVVATAERRCLGYFYCCMLASELWQLWSTFAALIINWGWSFNCRDLESTTDRRASDISSASGNPRLARIHPLCPQTHGVSQVCDKPAHCPWCTARYSLFLVLNFDVGSSLPRHGEEQNLMKKAPTSRFICIKPLSKVQKMHQGINSHFRTLSKGLVLNLEQSKIKTVLICRLLSVTEA